MRTRITLVLLALLSALANAAEVKLRNGTTMQGTVSKFRPAVVEITTARGVVTVPADTLHPDELSRIPQLKAVAQREAELLRRIAELEAEQAKSKASYSSSRNEAAKEKLAFRSDAAAGHDSIAVPVERSKVCIVGGKPQTMVMVHHGSYITFRRTEDCPPTTNSSYEMSVSMSPDGIAEFASILRKFDEWERLARVNNMVSLFKPIAKFGKDEFVFHWESSYPEHAPYAWLDPIEHCTAEDVRAMLDLVAQFPELQKEYSEKRKDAEEKLEASNSPRVVP